MQRLIKYVYGVALFTFRFDLMKTIQAHASGTSMVASMNKLL